VSKSPLATDADADARAGAFLARLLADEEQASNSLEARAPFSLGLNVYVSIVTVTVGLGEYRQFRQPVVLRVKEPLDAPGPMEGRFELLMGDEALAALAAEARRSEGGRG
jgi:hypothetical protein